jgi:hypothetical protein
VSERGYSRRRFLIVASGLGTAALAGLGLVARRTFERARAFEVGGLLADLPAATVLGQAWLTANPDRALPAELTEALLADLGPRSRRASRAELRLLVADRVAADYEEGRVESLKGWVLSRTEILLCALAAVTANSPVPPR